jgi:hypothetical protein
MIVAEFGEQLVGVGAARRAPRRCASLVPPHQFQIAWLDRTGSFCQGEKPCWPGRDCTGSLLSLPPYRSRYRSRHPRWPRLAGIRAL